MGLNKGKIMITQGTYPLEYIDIAKAVGKKRADLNTRLRNSNGNYYQKDPTGADIVGVLGELIAIHDLMKRGAGFTVAPLLDASPVQSPDLTIIGTDGEDYNIDVKGTTSNYKYLNLKKYEKAAEHGIDWYWFFKIDLKNYYYYANFHEREEIVSWQVKDFGNKGGKVFTEPFKFEHDAHL